MDPDPVLSDGMTYDITALPHALGLDAALTSPLSVAGEWVRRHGSTGDRTRAGLRVGVAGNGADAIRGCSPSQGWGDRTPG